MLAVAQVLLAALSLSASKDFVAPRAQNANTYPCKDVHPAEKVTAAIDLYNTAPKDNIFTTPFNQEGILPVFLILTNDGDQPIAVNDMQAELVTAGQTKLESLTEDDVIRRIAHISVNTNNPGRAGPIPLPGNGKNKKAQKESAEVESAIFTAKIVEPHSTKSGFLFFDVADVGHPVNGSHIYLTGVRDGSGNELMYFEIPVIPSNAANPGAP
jgi:hypothetical protein